MIMVNGDHQLVSAVTELDVHSKDDTSFNLDKDGFFFAVGVRNYLTDEYKDPMSTTRG